MACPLPCRPLQAARQDALAWERLSPFRLHRLPEVRLGSPDRIPAESFIPAGSFPSRSDQRPLPPTEPKYSPVI